MVLNKLLSIVVFIIGKKLIWLFASKGLIILGDTQKIFVTPEEERRIRADKLPDDTIQALAELDAKNKEEAIKNKEKLDKLVLEFTNLTTLL